MALPLRNERVRDRLEENEPLKPGEIKDPATNLTDEGLTTADLARSSRPTTEPKGPQSIAINRDVDATRGPNLDRNVRADSAADTTAHVRDNVKQDGTPLFPESELGGLRDQWKTIQTNFVDEPRRTVEQADGLVASAMKRLAEVFAEERSKLEQQWDRGDSVSTEDLRVALQRYRTFFERLLSV
jgi:hypothetical protein